MEKRKDVEDRLLRSAIILFGEKRAEEIRESLKERAEQLWRVSRAAPEFDGEEPACRFDLGESSPGHYATERSAPSDRSTPRRSSNARSGPPQDSAEMTASEAAAQIRAGNVTAAELVEACLRRVDAWEPELRAWATLDRDRAVSKARKLDDASELDGDAPLRGVPVGVKDVVFVNGLPMQAGSALYSDYVPDHDATVVRRLKQAGAIVLGKTQCTELATNDPAPTRNPWNQAHTPGGSSPGSAVAVATGMCFATVDTQTAGDTLRPAAYNGVVGFKPTYGEIGRGGVMPVAWSIDTIGVHARSVEDAALLMTILAGHEPSDPTSPAHPSSVYFAEAEEASRIHLGVVRDYFYERADEEVREHTDSVVETLVKAGAQVEEVSPPADLTLAHSAHRVVTFSECAALHQDLYAEHAETMGPKLRALIELGMVTPAVSYVQAQRVRSRLVRQLRGLFGQFDALIIPSAPGGAPADLTTTGDSSFEIPWTFCGFPAISLPAGVTSSGLPLGIQLVGAPVSDERLLSVARRFEQELDTRQSAPMAAAHLRPA